MISKGAYNLINVDICLLKSKREKIDEIKQVNKVIDESEFNARGYYSRGNIEMFQDYMKISKIQKDDRIKLNNEIKEFDEIIKKFYDSWSKVASEYYTKAEYYKKLSDSSKLGFMAFNDKDMALEIDKLAEFWAIRSHSYKKTATVHNSSYLLERAEYYKELSELCRLRAETGVEASQDISIKLNKLLNILCDRWSKDATGYSIKAEGYEKLCALCKLDEKNFDNDIEKLGEFVDKYQEYFRF